MKIYFIRHGESFDDIFNEFGGWSDRELSPMGIQTAFEITEKIKSLGIKFDLIQTSPLKRAKMTADIISKELNLRVEENAYLKERNTYGLLCGVNRDLAVEEYPEMNAAYLSGKYIYAGERYKDFCLRMCSLFDQFKKLEIENLLCVTHGHVITVIIEEFLGKIRNSVSNGSILGIEIKNDKMSIIYTDKLTFTEDPAVIEGTEFRKFKKD
jgi:broad specificity phosphatase PhoE